MIMKSPPAHRNKRERLVTDFFSSVSASASTFSSGLDRTAHCSSRPSPSILAATTGSNKQHQHQHQPQPQPPHLPSQSPTTKVQVQVQVQEDGVKGVKLVPTRSPAPVPARATAPQRNVTSPIPTSTSSGKSSSVARVKHSHADATGPPLLGLKAILANSVKTAATATVVVPLKPGIVIGRRPHKPKKPHQPSPQRPHKSHLDFGLTAENAKYIPRDACTVVQVSSSCIELLLTDKFLRSNSRPQYFRFQTGHSSLVTTRSVTLFPGDQLCLVDNSKKSHHRLEAAAAAAAAVPSPSPSQSPSLPPVVATATTTTTTESSTMLLTRAQRTAVIATATAAAAVAIPAAESVQTRKNVRAAVSTTSIGNTALHTRKLQESTNTQRTRSGSSIKPPPRGGGKDAPTKPPPVAATTTTTTAAAAAAVVVVVVDKTVPLRTRPRRRALTPSAIGTKSPIKEEGMVINLASSSSSSSLLSVEEVAPPQRRSRRQGGAPPPDVVHLVDSSDLGEEEDGVVGVVSKPDTVIVNIKKPPRTSRRVAAAVVKPKEEKEKEPNGSSSVVEDGGTAATSRRSRRAAVAKSGPALRAPGSLLGPGEKPLVLPWGTGKKKRTRPDDDPPLTEAELKELIRQEEHAWHAPALPSPKKKRKGEDGTASDSDSDDDDYDDHDEEGGVLRPRDMQGTFANTYWSALNTNTPHIGACLLHLLLDRRKLPTPKLCGDLIQLLTFGCHTGSGIWPHRRTDNNKSTRKKPAADPFAFWDNNRLQLADRYVEAVLLRYPGIAYDRFAEEAGSEYWKTVMDQLHTLRYVEEGETNNDEDEDNDDYPTRDSVQYSLQLHVYSVRTFHRLLNGLLANRICTESPLIRDMDQFGGKKACMKAAQALAHIWADFGPHTMEGTRLTSVVFTLTNYMAKVLVLLLEKFVPARKEQASILWDTMSAKLDDHPSCTTTTMKKQKEKDWWLQFRLQWVDSFYSERPELADALAKRLKISKEYDALSAFP